MKTLLGLSLLLLALGTASADIPNYVQNSRYEIFRNDSTAPRCCPVNVPTAGLWFPEAWRIAPGQNATIQAYIVPLPAIAGQGNALYIHWNRWQWVPCLAPPQSSCPPGSEYGAGFLEHYIFEYGSLAGHRVQLSFWAKVDGCCVGLVPQVQMHYAINDDQFILPAAVNVTQDWQQFTVLIDLPTGAGHYLDGTQYFAIVPTFATPTAPGLSLGHFEIQVIG